jgi:hypothetical protein
LITRVHEKNQGRQGQAEVKDGKNELITFYGLIFRKYGDMTAMKFKWIIG